MDHPTSLFQILLLFLSISLASAFQGQQAGRGYLGLALEDAPHGQGARVAQVAPGSPAAKAGLAPGDVLLSVNGVPAQGSDSTARFIRSLDPGSLARFSIIRGGNRREIAVTVGAAGPAAASSSPSYSSRSVPPAAPPPAAGIALEGAVPAALRFERLTDPLEHAFSIDSPAGWRSVAGLARTGLVQVNPYLRSISPDRMTYLLFGDPTFPTFLIPNQMRTTIGLREGSMSQEGVGGRSEIRRYQPGAEFARFYGQIALGNLCGGLKLISVRDLPGLAHKIEQADHNVIPTRYDAGQAEFTCVHKQQEMAGYAAAVTWITRDQIGMWVVRGFVGFITPKDKAAEGRGILQHITDSLVWDQAWIQRQTELSRQANTIIQQRIAQFERQQASFNARLNEMDRSFQQMDDIINGVGRYYDPQTGTHYELSSTNPNKWINEGGRIVGTPSGVKPPGYFWRPLSPAGGR